jgi:VanZ family protein
MAFGAFAAVVGLSLGPLPDPGLPDPLEDLPHTVAYAVLTLTLLVATHRSKRSKRRARWLLAAAVPLGVIALGSALEWTQGLVSRDVETADVLANAVGVAVAFVLWFAARSGVAALRSRRASR